MEQAKTTTIWKIARINYNEPWQHFLVKSLKPIVDTLSRTGIIDRYFWERHTLNGAHIRLYFRCEIEALETVVIPNLKEHFEAYFALHPSTPNAENPGWEPSNTIQFLDYKPDLKTWGGEIGMPIVERHFQSSSDTVLDFMQLRGDRWTSDDILATAIELHLGFADALEMDAEECVRFFEYCLLYQSTDEFSIATMENFFESQREPLIEFHSNLWEAIQSQEPFEEEIYNQWLEQCFYSAKDLQQTFRRRQLVLEARFGALWTLYARILRMTNNRLGLIGKDESLVYYLMMRCLEKKCAENYNT